MASMVTPPIKTAARVLAVFELLEAHRKPLPQKAFIEHLGYPASSMSGLLKSLVSLGYLSYDRNGRTYFPTMRIHHVGAWVDQALFGDGEIFGVMADLAQATTETVALGVHSDLFVQYVHTITSPHPLRYDLPIGARRPLVTTGTGWMILSALDDAQVREIVRRSNARERDGRRRVSADELMSRIRQARKDRYVFSKHTVFRGGGSVAVLLPRRPGGRIFSLSVHAPVERLDEALPKILRELRWGVKRMKPPARCGAERPA